MSNNKGERERGEGGLRSGGGMIVERGGVKDRGGGGKGRGRMREEGEEGKWKDAWMRRRGKDDGGGGGGQKGVWKACGGGSGEVEGWWNRKWGRKGKGVRGRGGEELGEEKRKRSGDRIRQLTI